MDLFIYEFRDLDISGFMDLLGIYHGLLDVFRSKGINLFMDFGI